LGSFFFEYFASDIQLNDLFRDVPRFQRNREDRRMHLNEKSIHGLVGGIYDGVAALDDAKTAALDGLDHGVLLIDASGHVLFANRAAEAIIALRDGVTVVRGGLRAALPADTARLWSLVARTLRGAAGGTIRLTRPSLAEPFLLLVAPARGKWHRPIDAMPAAVIFITARPGGCA
jgi:PAS domain-containing protein